MSIEFLNELEDKVSTLITTLENIRQENARLRQELEHSGGRVSEMEAENAQLKHELDSLRAESQGNQDKLSVAAERVQGLIARLESVQQ